MQRPQKHVIVILGSGRSGTSLLTSLVSSLGVRLSERLTGVTKHNPTGGYEDREILTISREILRLANRSGASRSYLPLPENFTHLPGVPEKIALLKEIVAQKSENDDVWGFKEPVTAKLLPIWKQIFAELQLKPVYLVALRSPKDVIRSFNEAYGTPPQTASLVWLSRYLDIVHQIGNNFALFDYDDWFKTPKKQLERLAREVGCDDVAINEAIKVIQAEHNHAKSEPLLRDTVTEFSQEIYTKLKALPCPKALRELNTYAEYFKAYLRQVVIYEQDLKLIQNDNNSEQNEALNRVLGRISHESLEKNLLLQTQKKLQDQLMQYAVQPEYIINRREIIHHVEHKLIAGVASFPARHDVFKCSIASVKDQFDHIYVFLNGYESTPDFLDSPKFTVFHSTDFCDLSANGKVFALGEIKDAYFFTLDDDILYPENYVSEMVKSLDKYENKVAVSVHGSIFPENPKWYFERLSLYPFQKSLDTDKFVTLIGSGTFAFHTSTLKADLADFLPDVMVDLRFSILAKQQNVPLVCVARPEMWLKALVKGEGLYHQFLTQKTIHTDMCIKYAPWSYEDYVSRVGKALGTEFFEQPNSDALNNKLDVKFIQAKNENKKPANWRESALYRKKVLERELYFGSDKHSFRRKLEQYKIKTAYRAKSVMLKVLKRLYKNNLARKSAKIILESKLSKRVYPISRLTASKRYKSIKARLTNKYFVK